MRLSLSALSGMSAWDACQILDAAEREVQEAESWGMTPRRRLTAQRRRIEELRRALFGEPA